MTVHKGSGQYGWTVRLADTPTTWLEGPSHSTLQTIGIFVGIPVLVIVTIYLLCYAPSWVKGPRYRPGQPWDARNEWFGVPIEGREEPMALESAPADGVPQPAAEPYAGGASAGW